MRPNQIPTIDFRFCQPGDVEIVCELLRSNKLPYEDFDLNKIKVILAVHGQDIIGSIGVESYPPQALLRSFVLHQKFRGLGIGKDLFQHLMSYCIQTGIKEVHLLTDTAGDYFHSKGFVITDRKEAPFSIKQTAEFRDLCPSTCTYMVKKDIDVGPGIFHSGN